MIQPVVTAEHVEIAVEQEPRRWAKAALMVIVSVLALCCALCPGASAAD
jgi:hypothetical protein